MDLNARRKAAAHDADREENVAYASCMAKGTSVAMLLIVAELLAYLSGALSPYVPLRDLPALWGMPMKEFLATARVPSGWGWIALAGRGDYVNFIGIALLASVTIACYLLALRRFVARRDRLYAAMAAAQLLVLLAAASGLISPAR